MTDASESSKTEETVELLQQLIRNACVNDGTPESGQEVRNADTLQSFLDGVGLDMQRYEPTPGRVSLVTRIQGSDPDAPSLCLMGHTDVVPVNESGWTRNPFAGERLTTDGVDEVWGRGAVDMLNLTASMAVAFKSIATSGFKPKGDLIFFAVADEESGSAHGMRWMADNARDAIMADYVLTENGGLHSGSHDNPSIAVTVAEKGVAWRRLRVKGVPGHGSMPYRRDNALVTAAGVIQRLTDYTPPATVTELWREQVDAMGLDAEMTETLLDPNKIDTELALMPAATASFLHACTHTTFSCNVLNGGLMKTNVIPDSISLDVDIRTLPGESEAEVQAHLDAALGDLSGRVEVEPLMNDEASISRSDTQLWDAIARAVSAPFPTARISPRMSVGFTDARIYREMGAVAYGAGLLSPTLDAGAFGSRFHGNDERIDIESLALTTQFWLDTIKAL
jgi:acetylornithine deacetylase/succinyl-diaminopimelate desuccinylase-like protein